MVAIFVSPSSAGAAVTLRAPVDGDLTMMGFSLRTTDTLLAGDLIRMTGRACLLERRHRHDPLIAAAVVTARTCFGNPLIRFLLRGLRIVLAEMPGMIEDNARSGLKRIVAELWVVFIEMVELESMA